MRKKIILGIFLIIVLGLVGYLVIINVFFNDEIETIEATNEITPEVEISDDELRTTIVTLYFVDTETGSIASEARLMDSKELLIDPYQTLVEMLIEGPKDSSLSSIIPSDTEVLDATLSGNCVTLNLSQEFIDNAPEGSVEKSNMIYTIVNTLTELKEVDSIKFLIEGEEISGFESDGINLTSEFTRKE